MCISLSLVNLMFWTLNFHYPALHFGVISSLTFVYFCFTMITQVFLTVKNISFFVYSHTTTILTCIPLLQIILCFCSSGSPEPIIHLTVKIFVAFVTLQISTAPLCISMSLIVWHSTAYKLLSFTIYFTVKIRLAFIKLHITTTRQFVLLSHAVSHLSTFASSSTHHSSQCDKPSLLLPIAGSLPLFFAPQSFDFFF